MKLRSVLVAAVAVGVLAVGVGWLAAGSPARGLVGRAEAVDRLEPLVGRFGVDLSQSQRRAVVADCPQIQAGRLDRLRDQLPAVQAKYDQFLSRAGGQIWILTNHLGAFADDASNLNLAMVELRRFRLDLADQLEAYDLNLQTAVAINCLAYPNHFVAGLYQLQDDQRQLLAAARALVDYVDSGIPAALAATECHLFDQADDDCPGPAGEER